MEIKWKKLHKDAKLPFHAKPGDAGLDLTAVSVMLGSKSEIEYCTGLGVEIPKGYVGLLFMRSSIFNKDIDLTNAVGVIDSGYRGEIKFKYLPTNEFWDYAFKRKDFQSYLELGSILYYERAEDEYRDKPMEADCYAVGDRIGQMVIVPYLEVESVFVEELEETERGTGGHGSTGK